MKKITFTVLLSLSLLLINCSGSDTYRGEWKAMKADGTKLEITFDAKKFTIKNDTGASNTYEYSQNSVSIENSVTTYSIKLDDGRAYQIKFPKSNDDTMALLLDENGNPLYTLGRKSYITYESLYKLE